MSAGPLTPRLFIIRHGETEWSLNGRHTGTTELSLTPNGEKRIIATGKALVGEDRLIVPSNLAHIYVSPRKRAQRTLELLGIVPSTKLPWKADNHSHGREGCNALVQITDAVREWDYGDYEGLTSAQIQEQRKAQGGEPKWDIWSEGCPGGDDITKRVDGLIDEIRAKFHSHSIGKDKHQCPAPDVLIVAHGHILRSFAARWINRSIADNPALILEAGGVGTLSYEHHSIHEPALLLGGAFTVPDELASHLG